MRISNSFFPLVTSLFTTAMALPRSAAAAERSRSITYEMKVQRAAEAAIWAMPAVSVYDIELSIQRDLGGKFGDVVYFSKPMTSRHGFLTANDVTPYVVSAQSTRDGPLVVEVPPAAEKVSYFGTFVDAWQTPIADVGPPGDDKGAGGKYLFLPPGHQDEVPQGYLVYRPAGYGVHFAFRPVAKNGGTAADQSTYAQTLKVYRLAHAANPPKTTFIDAYPKKWNTLPVYDMTYFDDLNAVIQREPVLERDKVMMAMLADLGIRKGQPFKPDAQTKKALLEGLDRAYAHMQDMFVRPGVALVPYWNDRQWTVMNLSREQAKSGFPFTEPDRLLLDERGALYFYATYLPKVLGGGSFYLFALKDKAGALLNGKDTYKLTVPKNTPAKDFWSVIVYSMKTKGFVEGANTVGLSSQDLGKMKKNPDGSVDVYFAPAAPAAMASNWIPTGEDFFLIFRLYGPEKPLFEKTWTLADVERVS
jgi:hypothetical protein